MFDYIKIEDDKLNGEFQTKALYNHMEKYLVHDKQLYLFYEDRNKFYEINWFPGNMVISQLNKNRELNYFSLQFDEGKLLSIREGIFSGEEF
jgi:hypothetical protein